jgi:hypothetical protein
MAPGAASSCLMLLAAAVADVGGFDCTGGTVPLLCVKLGVDKSKGCRSRRCTSWYCVGSLAELLVAELWQAACMICRSLMMWAIDAASD